MTEYTPTPGDSVKLVGKNSESIVYGVLDYFSAGEMYFNLTFEGADATATMFVDDWTITPWTRPVTFKTFAVVRLPEGWNRFIDTEAEYAIDSISIVRQSQGASHFWSDVTGDYELSGTSVATLLNHGAEILFAGVDGA